MTVLKTELRCHVTLIIILVFFEGSDVVPHTYNVSQLGLNWFRIYGGGKPFWETFRLNTQAV